MQKPFGRRQVLNLWPFKRAARTPALGSRRIIIKKSFADGASSGAMVFGVQLFVEFAERQAWYLEDELSPNAYRAIHTDYYLGQVNNGGHAQYAGNTGLDSGIVQRCQEGLDMMQASAAGLHRRFLAYGQTYPSRMEGIIAGGGFGKIDRFMRALDRKFYAADRQNPLGALIDEWVKSLPELVLVDDGDYKAELEAFAAENPNRDFRRTAPERAAEAHRQRDPEWQAMAYLCSKAPMPLSIVRKPAIMPDQDLGDGQRTFFYFLDTSLGQCCVYLHPQNAILTSPGSTKEPLVKVPTAAVVDHVEKTTGMSLMTVLATVSRAMNGS